jgi:hypothetical protein
MAASNGERVITYLYEDVSACTPPHGRGQFCADLFGHHGLHLPTTLATTQILQIHQSRSVSTSPTLRKGSSRSKWATEPSQSSTATPASSSTFKQNPGSFSCPISTADVYDHRLDPSVATSHAAVDNTWSGASSVEPETCLSMPQSSIQLSCNTESEKAIGDTWGDWKPAENPERQANEAYNRRFAQSQGSLVPTKTAQTSRSLTHCQSSRHQTASDPPPVRPSLAALPISPASGPSSNGHDDWLTWNPGTAAIHGEDAFQHRQALSSGASPSSLPPAVAARTLPIPSTSTILNHATNVSPSTTTHTVAASSIASVSSTVQSSPINDDPWGTWSGSPAAEAGGPRAFERRKALSAGVPVTSASSLTQVNPKTVTSITNSTPSYDSQSKKKKKRYYYPSPASQPSSQNHYPTKVPGVSTESLAQRISPM